MAEMRPQGQLLPHQGHGHEADALRIRGIFLFAVALILLAVVVHVVLGWFMAGFARREQQLSTLRPARFTNSRGQFPAPNLQDEPSQDMQNFVTGQRKTLSNYEWADRKARIARIPIDRAMDILVEKGLPTVTSQSQAGPSAGSSPRPESSP
jgi:hypothetical protein